MTANDSVRLNSRPDVCSSLELLYLNRNCISAVISTPWGVYVVSDYLAWQTVLTRTEDKSLMSKMMTPRFSNPHLRPLASKSISRREFFAFDDDEDSGRSGDEGDKELLTHLHQTIEGSLEFAVEDKDGNRRKRRKLERKSGAGRVDEGPLLFRLTSEGVGPIELQPRPPKPPSCYREPDYEDSEDRCKRRREQALAVAVDHTWIIDQSSIPYNPYPSTTKKAVRAHADAPGFATARLAVLDCLQPLRRTRPPVPRADLAHHPYMPGAPPPATPTKGTVPHLEIHLNTGHGGQSGKGRRKRRVKH